MRLGRLNTNANECAVLKIPACSECPPTYLDLPLYEQKAVPKDSEFNDWNPCVGSSGSSNIGEWYLDVLDKQIIQNQWVCVQPIEPPDYSPPSSGGGIQECICIPYQDYDPNVQMICSNTHLNESDCNKNRCDSNVVFFLNFEEENIFDSSSNKTYVESSNGCTTVQSKTGASSAYFDGFSYLSPSIDLSLKSGDFGINLWFRLDYEQEVCFMDWRIVGESDVQEKPILHIQLNSSSSSSDYWATINWTVDGLNIISAQAPPTNEWHHIAVLRESGLTRMLLDGVQVSDAVSDTTHYVGQPTLFGSTFDGPRGLFRGYADEVSINIGGSDVLSLNFEGDDAPVTVNGRIQFVDESDGSVYFPGNSSQIKASSNDFVIGNNDFTIDFWIFPTSYAFSNLVHLGPNGLKLKSSNLRGGLKVESDNREILTSTSPLELDRWQHIALVRKKETSGGCCRGSSSVLTLYVDGEINGQTVHSNKNLYSKDVIIGGGHPKLSFKGYIDDFRLVVGTSVYDSNFTPSTNSPPSLVVNREVRCINVREYDNELHDICGGPYQSIEQCTVCNRGGSSSSSKDFTPCFPEIIVTYDANGSAKVDVTCPLQPNSSSTSNCITELPPPTETIRCSDGSEIGKVQYSPDFDQCKYIAQSYIYGYCESSSPSSESSYESSSSSIGCEENSRYCLYSNLSLDLSIFVMEDKPPPCKLVYCCGSDGCTEVCEEDCAGTKLKSCPNEFDCCREGYCLYNCQDPFVPVSSCLLCQGMWFNDFFLMQKYIEDNCRLDCWECDSTSPCKEVSFYDKYAYPKEWTWTGQTEPICESPYYENSSECDENCCDCGQTPCDYVRPSDPNQIEEYIDQIKNCCISYTDEESGEEKTIVHN